MNVMVPNSFDLRPSITGKTPISILALLHWAFVRECAQLDFNEIASTSGGVRVATDPIWRGMQAAALGCTPDGGGRSEPHPDADVVASAVSALLPSFGGRAMAVQIAELVRAGQVPNWHSDSVTKCRPVGWKNTKRGAFAKTESRGRIWYKYRGRLVSADLVVCPVFYTDTADQIMAARRRYLSWWGALRELRSTFQIYGGLSCWTVTDEMPQRTPWQKTC
jgi:hypothetical protein